MLQSMREGAQSVWAKIIIALIVISFAIFGLETLSLNGSGTSAAEVNGDDISLLELDFAIQQQRRIMSDRFGDQLDPSMLDDDLLRPAALESLIQRRLLNDYAADLALAASPRAVGRLITNDPNFQIEGVFDADFYRQVLATQGLSPDQYRLDRENTNKLTQLDSAIAADFITTGEQTAAANIVVERRDIRYLEVPSNKLVMADAVDETAIEAFYSDNVSLFQRDEEVQVDYVILQPADYSEPVDPSVVEDELDAAKAEFEARAEAEVAHILLTPADDEDDGTFDDRVTTVAQRLDAGDAFADLAQEFSDDIGSAAIGGDLGFTDGSVFPDAMEEAIAGLSVGEVSAPVETDAGVHFILLKQRSAPAQPDDAQLREEILASLQQSQAETALLLVVDELRDAVFSSPTLGEAAEQLGLTVLQSEYFSENGAEGLFGEPALRAAAFSAEVLEDRNNSEVIELAGNRFVALQVTDYRPPGTKPLTEVKSDVESQVRSIAQRDALDALRAAVNLRLLAGDTLESIAQDEGLEWQVELAATRQNTLLDPAILNAAFTIPANETKSVLPVPLSQDSFALVQLARVTVGDLSTLNPVEVDAFLGELSRFQTQLMYEEFMADLRRNGNVIVR